MRALGLDHLATVLVVAVARGKGCKKMHELHRWRVREKNYKQKTDHEIRSAREMGLLS